ncbi:hypothetical protein EDB92DRAFT_2102592 [Lactarius akahatsu]|uniref:Uncharacterized protein n=1 Tax=Lactarius akahatsu TaxID=416441 RepID=A0AAD4LK82_9AGAM|nr:hypothetical protein EDB92DRAFT_2037224 [Lactarius akahatsu]KAH8994186.1 hypothetical protein EDB92DRAFT_2102592 [Lactarius akahatsu]
MSIQLSVSSRSFPSSVLEHSSCTACWRRIYTRNRHTRPLVQKFNSGDHTPTKKLTSMSIKACQEWLVMLETGERRGRDVRSIRWLINSTAVNAEMEPLLLAIPGSFNIAWGQEVRREVSSQAHDTYFENEEARRKRMRACVEAVASFVCCIDCRLDRFGEIDKLVSEIGYIEKINQSPTSTPDPSSILCWTCLSLVAIQWILGSNFCKGTLSTRWAD